ncbi:hypothetical protein JOL79_24185 [Microbispora sp. RL4-1S]|uniref:Uncharacterized protein n=1 Tax=Microbispora oryzae TaxID=2806554 RepID=A0A940WTN3_9ACTN|nr:hypothetical protein [Microbispora oryzae]MBP2706911.1 hypothetical protein [Microbispora oryzae]
MGSGRAFAALSGTAIWMIAIARAAIRVTAERVRVARAGRPRAGAGPDDDMDGRAGAGMKVPLGDRAARKDAAARPSPHGRRERLGDPRSLPVPTIRSLGAVAHLETV